jgi:acyl-coenzyme A thioesterase PaaI-like protein
MHLPGRTDEVTPGGSLPSGLLAAAVDQCVSLAAVTVGAPGELPSTASFRIDYLRAALAPVSLRATVERKGRTVVFVSLEVADRDGQICARSRAVVSPMSVNRNVH